MTVRGLIGIRFASGKYFCESAAIRVVRKHQPEWDGGKQVSVKFLEEPKDGEFALWTF
jgi:hypothetical protein